MTALFVSAAIFIGALVLYRKSLVTAVFRGLAIIVLYLIIVGFSVPIKKEIAHTSPLVLIDASQSMEPHLDSIQSGLKKIEFKHAVLYFCGESIFADPDSIEQYSTYTDIVGALASVQSIHPTSILLISDGNHNYQGTTLSQLHDYDIPVFTFGIGVEGPRDVELLEVIYPDYVYLNDSIDIGVVVQSHGFDQGAAVVELSFDRSKKVLRSSFPLSKSRAKNTLTFHTEYAHAGDTAITVTILPSPGEISIHNNTKKCHLTPIDQKIRVIYYTDHISFNAKFIMQALDQHPRLEATCIARTPSGHFLDPRTGTNQSLPLLDTVNALIVDNISCSTFPWPHVSDVVKGGLGLLCLGTILELTPEWQTLLPITIAQTVVGVNAPVIITNGFSCLALDKTYPPFYQIQRVLGVREQAVIIAKTNNIPVIAYQRYGQGTVFQMNAVNIGTWHFMQKGMQQIDIFSQLLPDIIRFIAPEGRNKRLILSSSQRTVTIGERVDFELKSYDLDLRLAGNGDFGIKIYDREIPFFETQKGIYHTWAVIEQPGNVKITASGMLGSEELTSNPVTIQVKEGSLENVQTLNQRFLNEISQQTGGAYYSIDSLGVFKTPQFSPAYRTTSIDLNNPVGYLLVVIFFALDWIIRRRQGIV